MVEVIVVVVNFDERKIDLLFDKFMLCGIKGKKVKVRFVKKVLDKFICFDNKLCFDKGLCFDKKGNKGKGGLSLFSCSGGKLLSCGIVKGGSSGKILLLNKRGKC